MCPPASLLTVYCIPQSTVGVLLDLHGLFSYSACISLLVSQKRAVVGVLLNMALAPFIDVVLLAMMNLIEHMNYLKL